jgi:hypothetical protein
MLFMLVSRPKPGMKREQLTLQVHQETWDPIRQGELSQILYKVGDEPRIFGSFGDPRG